MNTVYIFRDISQEKKKFIENSISKFDGKISNGPKEADIIICDNPLLHCQENQAKPFYITFLCFESMVNRNINPFKFNFQSNCLFNIFLYEKSFSFIKINSNYLLQYTNLIHSMGGTIVSENPDYYITDNQKIDESMIDIYKKVINSCWIYLLQNSKEFVKPDDFLIFSKFEYDKDFFEYAFIKYCNHKHWSYSDLKQNLLSKYPLLKIENDSKFKDVCQLAFNKLKSILKNENGNSPLSIQKLDQKKIHSIFINLNNYDFKMKNLLPNMPINNGPWSETETENLILILKEGFLTNVILNKKGQIKWPIVSKYIIGRTGESCKNRYFYLNRINDERIKHIFDEEIDCKVPNYKLNDRFYKALIPEEEQLLFQKISCLLKENKLVTMKTISDIALKIFNSPLNIAVKSFIISKLRKNENPYNQHGELNLEKYENELKDFFDEADSEPQKLIEDYLNDFQASQSWVYNFMMRHQLVFKKAHYKRRGAVDQKQVDNFLNEVEIAIEDFGSDFVVNMDETSVLTQNMPARIISHKGQDNVTFEGDKMNTKEATTFIGAICLNPKKRIPIGVVAKGRTKRCERKFDLNDEKTEFTSHSLNGWTTTQVIISYLHWLKKKMGNKNFALILDVYKSHISEQVKETAKNLGIRLIYVPASGTSIYQPLDIKVFGITKKKLSQEEKQNPIKMDKSRHKIIANRMIKIFDGLTNDSINAAWEIPSLNKLRISDNDEESSEFRPEEEDSNEK